MEGGAQTSSDYTADSAAGAGLPGDGDYCGRTPRETGWTGYPDRLTARDLSVESRIIAVADVFGAFSEDRPYRQELGWRRRWRLCRSLPRISSMGIAWTRWWRGFRASAMWCLRRRCMCPPGRWGMLRTCDLDEIKEQNEESGRKDIGRSFPLVARLVICRCR